MNRKTSDKVHTENLSLSYHFSGVHVHRRNSVFIKGSFKSLDNANVPHTFILRWNDSNLQSYVIKKGVTSMIVIEEPDWRVFSLCNDGLIHIASESGITSEELYTTEVGPDIRRWMWKIRQIGKHLYAVGMNRMVYKRMSPGHWIRINQGAEVQSFEEIESGFRSIDGFDEDSIYAVGFRGEIWHFNKNCWQLVDSPTNLRLDAVKCISPNSVYACGASGIILSGCGNSWSIIEHDETSANLWDIEYFKDKIYFADGSSLFVLENDEFSKVDLQVGNKIKTSYLHANDGVLCSVGETELVIYDGNTWKVVELSSISK